MRLSEHFTLPEFTRSEAAARLGISMVVTEQVQRNLERLANEVLEPIREAVGVPLYITSGYRPFTLNSAIGGSPTSAHMGGRAADFVAIGMPLHELARIAKGTIQSLPVAKLIDEFNQWLHVEIEPYGTIPRRQTYYALRRDNRTVYEVWS